MTQKAMTLDVLAEHNTQRKQSAPTPLASMDGSNNDVQAAAC